MVISNTQNRLARRLTTISSAALVAATLYSASTAQAQTVTIDSRWQAYSGCWEPVDGPSTGARITTGSMVCVVPSANGRSADIASISNRKILHVDRLTATGERINKSIDGCNGWESATWSKDGHRLFIRSEFKCGDTVKVNGSTMYSISSEGTWVHVQGNTVGKNADARVTVFKVAQEALAPDMVLADSAIIRTVAAERTFAERMVRLAAAEPATVDGVLEISRNTDKQVAQTWVAQFGKPASLSAKELVALADAGMPAELIDIMIAKAYPERFALQANSAPANNGARPTNADIARANGGSANCGTYGRMFGYRGYYNSNYDCAFGYNMGINPYGMYGMNYGYGFGNGFGFGNYFPGSQPIIIVTAKPDGGIPQPQGRAVRGQGYTRDQSTSSSQPRSSGSSGSSSSGSYSPGSSSGGSSGSTSSGASSGGSSSGRTAVPKPPSI